MVFVLLWVGHLFHFEFHLLFGFWYRFQFLCSNQYLLCPASLPGCPVLFNPLFFCLRQRRIPYTVYGRAGSGLAGISSIWAYCLFGVVHISFNVNQVIEFIPTVLSEENVKNCHELVRPRRGKKNRAISRPFVCYRYKGCSPLYGLASLSLLCSGRPQKWCSYHTRMPII